MRLSTSQRTGFAGGLPIGVTGIARYDKRARFYSTFDLVNTLEREKADGRPGRIAQTLMHLGFVIMDEKGYLPFSQGGGALLFRLLSKLYERTSVMVATNLTSDEWASTFEDGEKPRLC